MGIREGGKVGRRGDWRMGEKRAVYGQQAVLWNWQAGGRSGMLAELCP